MGTSKNGNGIKHFGNKLICWCEKKDCGWNTTHATNFHIAYKQNPTTFCLPYNISTWRVFTNQMKHHLIWLQHLLPLELSKLQILLLQLKLALVPPTIYCTSRILLHLLVWTSLRYSLWMQTLQSLPMSSVMCLIQNSRV